MKFFKNTLLIIITCATPLVYAKHVKYTTGSGSTPKIEKFTSGGSTFTQTSYGQGNGFQNFFSGPSIQEAGQLETKMVDIAGINSINATGIGNVTIEQCTNCEESLIITADKNILPYITHEISNQQLTLGLKSNVNIQTKTPIEFHVIVKDINKISLGGNGNMHSKGTIKTNILDIIQAGNGNIKLSSDTDKITTNLSGNGTIELSGKTNEQSIALSGNGTYNAYDLHSQNTSIFLSGMGNVYVHILKKLSYNLSGMGNIYYKGNPKVSGSKSGFGNITKG